MSNNKTSPSASPFWRDVLPIHPAALLFPRMSADELKALTEDIKRNGQQQPIAIIEKPRRRPDGTLHVKDPPVQEVLDGISRLDAMEAAGIRIIDKDGQLDDHIKGLVVDTDEVDPVAFVISANIHRRHLTGEQKRDLIAKLIKATPEKSDRQIAETVKASPTTVGTVRAELEAKGDLSKLDTRKDSKGREQPAKKTITKRGTVKFTVERIQQIRNLVERGKTREEIAEIIGVTVGSLQTTCSRLGISLRKPAASRDDGDDSTGEAERLRARVEELQADKRRLEIKIAGLESEIEDLKGAAKSAPESKSGSRCSICHEKKHALLRPVFICDGCVDVYEVREAIPPPDDVLDIPKGCFAINQRR